MKKLLVIVMIFCMGFAFTTDISAQTKDKKAASSKVSESKPFNTVCPVSGEKIDGSSVTYAYGGKTYALCCKSCLKKFKKDPAKYSSNLSEDGKKFTKQKTK